MNIRTLGWVLGAACLVTGSGFATIACSSSTTPGSTGDPADSGGSNPDTGAATPDTGGGGGSDAGTGPDCASAPTLHLGDGGSLFCPFGPDSGALDCPTATTICCVGGEISKGNYAVSQCGDPSQTCPNPLPDGGKYPARRIECEETADCKGDGGPMVCCATGGVPANTSCGFYRESPGLTAATCTAGATCPAGQFQVCESDIECGSGHTCIPFRAIGMELGFCQ
jgi:hypothetical protein